MDKSLKTFHYNKDLEDNVKAYLIDFLEKEAIKKVFDKEDVSGFADAKDVIDKAFDNLDILFPKKLALKEIINEAK